WAAQAMHHNSVVVGLVGRLFSAPQAVGIFAMDDVDMMSVRDQCARQRPHKNAITTKVVGRIKRGDHAKAHRPSIANLASPCVLLYGLHPRPEFTTPEAGRHSAGRIPTLCRRIVDERLCCRSSPPSNR